MANAPKTHPRPLSPHLQIYRPQITSVLSITHRLTGIALYLGLLLWTLWLFTLAAYPDCHAWLTAHVSAWYGQIALLGWTFCFFYHLLNGVRHLAWDAGVGFDLPSVTRTGWVVVCGSILLTAFTYATAQGWWQHFLMQ